MTVSIRRKIEEEFLTDPEILDISQFLLECLDRSDSDVVIDPDHVMISDDGQITINHADDDCDTVFLAPERMNFVCQIEGLDKADSSRATSLFSLGMLMYYMAVGEDWYSHNEESVLGLSDYRESRDALINDGSILFGLPKLLTDWDPTTRITTGEITLKNCIDSADSYATLHYVYNGSDVFSETIETGRNGLTDFGSGLEVKDDAGNAYRVLNGVSIKHRPGTHDVKLDVILAEPAIRIVIDTPNTTIPTGITVKTLLIESDDMNNHSVYDAGVLYDDKIVFKTRVNLGADVKYTFYAVEKNGNEEIARNLIGTFNVPAYAAKETGDLMVYVDEYGQGQATIYVGDNAEGEHTSVNGVFHFVV